MLVSLTYTYAQDSLGNVTTRTTIVILQLSLNQPLPAFAYCGRASLFCIIGITCVFVACLPVINFSSVQVPTTGPTIQLYIACTNRIACKAKESSSILWWAPTSNERNNREKNLIWCAMMWWWLSSAEERGERGGGGGGGVLRLFNITCVIWPSPLPLSWNRIACPPPPFLCPGPWSFAYLTLLILAWKENAKRHFSENLWRFWAFFGNLTGNAKSIFWRKKSIFGKGLIWYSFALLSLSTILYLVLHSCLCAPPHYLTVIIWSMYVFICIAKCRHLGCFRLPPPGILDSTGFHWKMMKPTERWSLPFLCGA